MQTTPSYLVTSAQPARLSYIMAAVVLHVGVFGLFFIARHQYAPTDPSSGLVVFRLVPPSEGSAPLFMESTNPDAAMPPEGEDQVPDGDITPNGTLDSPLANTADDVDDAQLAELLAAERDALRNELKQLTDVAMATDAPARPIPMPPPEAGNKGSGGPGPEGAVRELDLDGFPQAVVDDIMKRYKLKVVTRKLEAGKRGQNFLSSATRGESERFFGGQHTVPEGVYEVFQLSRDSVAHMSRLEEEALKKEGLQPLKSRVIRIVFGIVKSDEGKYELGVKTLEAEPVQ